VAADSKAEKAPLLCASRENLANICVDCKLAWYYLAGEPTGRSIPDV